MIKIRVLSVLLIVVTGFFASVSLLAALHYEPSVAFGFSALCCGLPTHSATMIFPPPSVKHFY
jgi:hypothetical protein